MGLLLLTGMCIVLDWELPRLIFVLGQFAATVTFIGYATFWNLVWIAGTSCYVVAFSCFGPVAARQGKGAELQDATSHWVPWHKVGRNGWHEDFHNFLFLADACYFVNALISGPSAR